MYKSKRLKRIPLKNDDIYVATQTGDRLDLLANEFYNNPHLWWFIAHVNNLNTMNLEPGIRLRISFDLNNANDILDKTKQ